MSREKDEFQRELDTLIALEIACREARIASIWLEPRLDRAHVLIRDKRNYKELKEFSGRLSAA